MLQKSMALMVILAFTLGTGVVMAQEANTNVGEDTPSVDNIDAPQVFEPALDNEVNVTVTDNNGMQDVNEVEIILYRSDVSQSAPDDLRNHYTVTYTNDAPTGGSLTVSPNTGEQVSVTLNSGLDNSTSTDTVNITFVPEDFTAPTVNTDNATVNSYSWQVVAIAKDTGGSSGTSTLSREMNRRLALNLDASQIDASGAPNTQDVQYSPNLGASNNGNVNLDLNITGTDQTNATTSDIIPIENLKANDANDPGTATSYPAEGNGQNNIGTDITYDTQQTIYNWVDIPQIQQREYSGTVDFTAIEESAK